MKPEIDRKINLSFYCVNCGFKIFETIDAEELNHLLKIGTIFAKVMWLYCLKCREKTKSKNPQVAKANKEKTMLLSKYALCNSKKSRFIKKQASRLLSSLESKTSLSKIPLLDGILS